MSSKYASGREVEYKIQRFLEGEGYNTLRSAGSKGAFDIIAWNSFVTRRIQAKRELKKSSYSADLKKIASSLSPPNSTKELWVYRTRVGWRLVEIIESTDGADKYELEVPEIKG